MTAQSIYYMYVLNEIFLSLNKGSQLLLTIVSFDRECSLLGVVWHSGGESELVRSTRIVSGFSRDKVTF